MSTQEHSINNQMWNDNIQNGRRLSENGAEEESGNDQDIKLQLYNFREEHSVEIRENKRNKILKKNRVLGIDQMGGSQLQNQGKGVHLDLNYIQATTAEEYEAFRTKYIIYDRDESTEDQKDQNVRVLISALTSNCTPQFFIYATSELHMYFQDEDLRTNITIQDIYRFIDIIQQSNFMKLSKMILSDWSTAIALTPPQQNTYFYQMASVNQQLARNYLIGCLNILCGISRGSDLHCAQFQEQNFLQTFFDIFDATKTQRDISEVMLFIIGNIAATRNVWRIFFMQRDFHNTIFAYLKFAPKNQENLVLHRRICWCLSNFTRDYVSVQQNNGSSQIQANGLIVTEIQENSTFDFSHIRNLCDTFIQYTDPEIRTDISWTFSQLVTIFFNDTKYHPLLSGNVVKQNGQDVFNFNGNPQQMQLYKSIVSEKIGFLIQNGICEYINVVLPSADMTVLVPTLRIINKLMQGSADILELFFSKCNDTIMQNITRHLQNQVQAVRRESVKTVHYMFLSEFEKAKEIWFSRFMQIILSRFTIEQYSTKEEVYKLINSIVDKVNPSNFEILVFPQNNKYCIFKTMKNSLSVYETKPEAIIIIISIVIKILSYYKQGNSVQDNQKIKRIMQLLEQNNIPQHIEKLQDHQLQGIYEYSMQFIEMYNNIQDNIIEEEQKDTNTHTIQQQIIQQDYLRLKPNQNCFESADIEKCHEEQKI